MVVSHGGSVTKQKPAPDLFLYAVRQLDLQPTNALWLNCSRGISGIAVDFHTLGLGPRERVGEGRDRHEFLQNVRLNEILPIGSIICFDVG